jgi:uncharacterized protein (DUF1330 family)
MAALLMLNFEVTNPAVFQGYRAGALKILIDKHGGKLTCVSSVTRSLLAEVNCGSSTVIIEYPSVQQAESAYRDPGYAELIRQRLAASTPFFESIVEI